MNKSVYAFVVILALAVLLAACGSSGPGHSRHSRCNCPSASS